MSGKREKPILPKKGERRIMSDKGLYGGTTPVVCMVAADGYVMVRRPGCLPFVLHWRAWQELPQEAPRP